jgi:hypothetical protein
MNSLVEAQAYNVATNDGWSDAAADGASRVIRGTLLKFSDGTWLSGKENIEINRGTRLLAVDCAKAWCKWRDGKPEYRVQQPGAAFPEREELGDDDKSIWEAGINGEPRDPWSLNRMVYLIDPRSQGAYTFVTSSWGGRGAVIDLADAVRRKRFSSPSAIPLVELQSAPHVTKYGRKTKPLFKLIEWRNGLDDEGEPEPKPAPKLVSPHSRSDMDDDIPW